AGSGGQSTFERVVGSRSLDGHSSLCLVPKLRLGTPVLETPFPSGTAAKRSFANHPFPNGVWERGEVTRTSADSAVATAPSRRTASPPPPATTTCPRPRRTASPSAGTPAPPPAAYPTRGARLGMSARRGDW